MQNQMGYLESRVRLALRNSENFLISNQSQNGLWQEYNLPPGLSESWTTACVGWSLLTKPYTKTASVVLDNAANAIKSLQQPSGWSYNRNTATDADSTAWSIRFLHKMNRLNGNGVARMLTLYLDSEGFAHTFLDKSKFGCWADAHIDVTALVGTAFIEINILHSHIDKIRCLCRQSQNSDGSWNSIWWTEKYYAISRCLRFLNNSGGIPNDVSEKVAHWMLSSCSPTSSFDYAHRLMALLELNMSVEESLLWVLDSQLKDGSWLPSPVLRVPNQNSDGSVAVTFEDTNRLMSTAMIVEALKFYLIKANENTQN